MVSFPSEYAETERKKQTESKWNNSLQSTAGLSEKTSSVLLFVASANLFQSWPFCFFLGSGYIFHAIKFIVSYSKSIPVMYWSVICKTDLYRLTCLRQNVRRGNSHCYFQHKSL